MHTIYARTYCVVMKLRPKVVYIIDIPYLIKVTEEAIIKWKGSSHKVLAFWLLQDESHRSMQQIYSLISASKYTYWSMHHSFPQSDVAFVEFRVEVWIFQWTFLILISSLVLSLHFACVVIIITVVCLLIKPSVWKSVPVYAGKYTTLKQTAPQTIITSSTTGKGAIQLVPVTNMMTDGENTGEWTTVLRRTD